MSEIRQDGLAQLEEALEDARTEQTEAQQRAQQLLTQRGVDLSVLGSKRQRLTKMRQIAARRRTGMQLQARFAAARAAADRSRGSRSLKLLETLKQRKQGLQQDKTDKANEHDKQEKQHSEHKAHAEHKLHEQQLHEGHSAPRDDTHSHGVDRLDRDGGQGSGRQRQQQEDDRPPIVKVKLSKRISPSAIRSDLRHLADAHADQPLRLEIQTRLAWTRTCLGFGQGLNREPNAAVTPLVLGSSLDLVSARLQHAPLRDSTRQTGLLGAKHQLQTVQDERGYRADSPGELLPRQKDLNVLKPLLVLHGERPYTRTQLRLSICRIRTLLFATGQTVDPRQALRAERAKAAARVSQGDAHNTPARNGTRAANDSNHEESGPAS
ncbi:MAG TPA: hypothetical protein VL635_00190 [Trinickia sp.]|nr:hypothetical protein [Trinickia sp.]